MQALQDRYRVIAVTYPPVASLQKMSEGVLAILAQEGVDEFRVVGSSLGGYLAQYLVVTYPEALAEKVVAPKILEDNTLKLKIGEKEENYFL